MYLAGMPQLLHIFCFCGKHSEMVQHVPGNQSLEFLSCWTLSKIKGSLASPRPCRLKSLCWRYTFWAQPMSHMLGRRLPSSSLVRTYNTSPQNPKMYLSGFKAPTRAARSVTRPNRARSAGRYIFGAGGWVSNSQLRKREVPPEAVTLLVKLSDHKECQTAFVQGDSEGIIIAIITIIPIRIISMIITISTINIMITMTTTITIGPARGDRVCPSSCQGFLSLRNAAEVMKSVFLLLQNPPSRTRQPL